MPRSIWDVLAPPPPPGGPAPSGPLDELLQLSRAFTWPNLDPGRIPGLPEGGRRLMYGMLSPPSHSLGWPYPGFQDQAYGTTGIQPATGSPLLNWWLWGWGLTPDQPRSSAQDYFAPFGGGGPPTLYDATGAPWAPPAGAAGASGPGAY